MKTQAWVRHLQWRRLITAALASAVVIWALLAAAALSALRSPAMLATAAPATSSPIALAAAPDGPQAPGSAVPQTERQPRGSTPAFTGLNIQADDEAGYSLWYPDGWQISSLGPNRYGIVLTPGDGNDDVWVSLEARQIRAEFTADQMPDLVAGFHDLLGVLPDVQIEWEDSWSIGSLIGVEAKLTFRDGDARAKRWVRLLFDGRRQFSVVAHAASVDSYTYWEPMLFEMMTTVALNSDYYWDGGEPASEGNETRL